MISSKISQLSKDIVDIEGTIEEFKNGFNKTSLMNDAFVLDSLTDLKDKLNVLKQHFKDHKEVMENFICDIK